MDVVAFVPLPALSCRQCAQSMSFYPLTQLLICDDKATLP